MRGGLRRLSFRAQLGPAAELDWLSFSPGRATAHR